MTDHDDPLDQMSALRIEIDGDTREAQLEKIEGALREVGHRRRRRWPLAAVVAALIAGPVTAIASDSAVPGDVLYPVKLIVEPALRLFDTDAVAHNRVDEVRVLIDRVSDEEVIVVSIDAAREELAKTDAPDASRELDRLVADWVTDRATLDRVPSDERPPGSEPNQRDDRTDREPPEPVRSDRDSPATIEPPRDVTPPTSTSTTTATDQPRTGDEPGDRPPP